MSSSRWLAVAIAIAWCSEGVSAQDVEMLGRRYGANPPAGYYREMARNPEAFQFRRGRAGRMRASIAGPGAPVGARGGPSQALGPREGPVTGTINIPVVMGLFSDSPTTPPYDQGTVQVAYFGAQPGTVSDYYSEVSSDSVTLIGDVMDWVQSSMTQSQVTQGEGALVCCGIGDFIKDVLGLQPALDWGVYDNDGADGVPNSGDDDGFVDALAVMHPTRGAECGGGLDRVWSHKWTLTDASGSVFSTDSPAAGGGFIRVDDYFVQGVVSCNGSSLNEIGVFAHETGHAFGLPDLYDTRASGATHSGAGRWELMAAGTWGCNGVSPAVPCHLGAWSKAVLGWVDVTTLPPDTDLGTLTLPPVETTGAVYRVDAADGSGEYFLLENRQSIGFDQGLYDEGLLIWQIDEGAVAARWPQNTVNSNDHMGVWLRQADGCDDLGRTGGPPPGCDSGGLNGDAGDPFPGQFGNTEFHAGSNPASVSFQGTATGLTVLDIVAVGSDDIDFRLLTRFTTLTVGSSGTNSPSGLLTVDGAPLADPPANFVLSAPFSLRAIEAAAGALIQPGERRPFLQWDDAPAESRTRIVATPLIDASYVAAYAGTEYELHIDLNGGINGVAPGTLATTPPSPDSWFGPGTDVAVIATPQTGFNFLGWTGDLLAQPNPAAVTMNAPVLAGADFQLTYSASDALIALTATVQEDVQLAVTNGTSPVSWRRVSGTMPVGIQLSTDGRISGAALALGTFPLMVEATDSLGLTATADITLEIGAPTIPIAQLASPFLLGGPALDAVQETFLDLQGNGMGGYDLGDFRAWVLSNPGLPLSVYLARAPEPRTVTLPVRLEARAER